MKKQTKIKKKHIENANPSPWDYDPNGQFPMSIEELPAYKAKRYAENRALLDKYGFYDVEPVV